MVNLWDSHLPYLEILSELAPQGEGIYLVGGAVRDLLMGRVSHDLDFVVEGDARPLARRLASRLDGDFYMLDPERQTARVLLREKSGAFQCFDFGSLRAASLESDLNGRDFTVNAIAIDIRFPKTLIDPLGGGADLRNKQLRACSDLSFQDDPLRVLRGVRLGLELGFGIQPATIHLMREGVNGLKRISSERIRDELFRILEGVQPAAAVRLLDHLGALSFILPELAGLKGVRQTAPHQFDAWEHTLVVITELEKVFAVLCGSSEEGSGENLVNGMMAMRLGGFRERFRAHFAERLNPNRSKRGLLFLAALFHDCAKPMTQEVGSDGRIHFFNHEIVGSEMVKRRGAALALSQVEVERLMVLVRHHMRIHLLADDAQSPTRRAVFCFFKSVGNAGIELVMLTLADRLATQGVHLNPEDWQRELDVCRILLEAWWEQREEVVQPVRLISGNDLLSHFGLEPGQKIGELLEAIYEAQALGEVTTKDEALKFAETRLKLSGGGLG